MRTRLTAASGRLSYSFEVRTVPASALSGVTSEAAPATSIRSEMFPISNGISTRTVSPMLTRRRRRRLA